MQCERRRILDQLTADDMAVLMQSEDEVRIILGTPRNKDTMISLVFCKAVFMA